tara:strand:- start:316 stop:1437 length:1122 start_codon:yes stop_codon:yes gene_type:complete
MKIGFDSKRAFLNNTGLGNYSRDTIRVLKNFYIDNIYYLYTTKKTRNSRLTFLEDSKNTLICTPKSLFNKVLKSYWRSFSIVSELLNQEIDIFHGLSNEIPFGIEKTNIKTVVTIHDLIFIRYPNLYNTIDRNIYFKKFKSACDRASKIIAISKQTKKDIIEYFLVSEEKIEVVYQGCNKVFQNDINKKRKDEISIKYNLPKEYLLYVGTIEVRKNLLTVLKVLKELPKKKLVVIGNGKAYKQKCLQFISEYRLKDRVTIINKIDINEMAAIYQNAKLFIYPSIFEGFGIPIIEALFSKIPVITSKEGCFSEAGGPHSMYIDPMSENEIKDAINEIENSNKLREKMIKEGYKYAQRFKDEEIAKNLMVVYKNL